MSSKAKRPKKKQQETTGNEALTEILQYLVAAFVIVLSIALIFYLYDGYSNVGESKFTAYKWVGGIGLAMSTVLALICFFTTKDKSKVRFHNVDISSAVFIVMCFVSAIAGGNFGYCVWGYQGWYMGIISQVSFVLLYLVVSRYGKFANVIMIFMLGAASIAFLIGILHVLRIDIIGVYYLGTDHELSDYYKKDFLSTMGQVSWYSSFVATVLPLGLGFFWLADDKKTKIWSGIVSFLGCMTLISQNAESAIVALAGFMMVFYWFSVSDIHRMERFWRLVVLFVASTRLTRLLFYIWPNTIRTYDFFNELLINNNLMWILLLLVVAIWGAFYYTKIKNRTYHVKLWIVSRYVALGLLVLVIVVSATILIISAMGLTPDWLANLTANISYLNWNDDWGNHRGMSWTMNWIMFRDYDILHKLVGVGPDGYAFYAYNIYQDTLEQMFPGLTLCNAHNEWMNSLINLGIIGCTAYMGIYILGIRNFARMAYKKPVYVGYIACIVSYMAHNFFCYEQVCCTPFIFIIIGLGMFMYREDTKDEPVKTFAFLDKFKNKEINN